MYNKANSIIEIRHKDHDYQRVFERIQRLSVSLEVEPRSDYRTRIVRNACHDILNSTGSDSRPRFNLREHVVEDIKQLSDTQLSRYLFYRYRYDVFPQTKQLDDFPPCLQIEPTSICNYRCVFCYQTDSEFTLPRNGHMGMMDLDLFKRIVDQAEGACEAVTLASRGEPFLCRDIKKMLAYMQGKFLALKINTNAWYLDEQKAHTILQSGVNTLVFSADAASEPLYSQLRVNGKLERILANIEKFQNIRSRDYPDSKVITRVSGVRYSADQNLDEMERLWGNLVDQVAFVDYNPWENTYQRPVNDVITPCSDLWRRMFVWYDGTVNPCDVDYKSSLAVGNVKQDSLSELWKGEKYSAYRRAHLTRQRSTVNPCNRCTVT